MRGNNILILITFLNVQANAEIDDVDDCKSENCKYENFKVWGPGLKPHEVIMPARYFFVQFPSTTSHAESSNESPVDLSNQFKSPSNLNSSDLLSETKLQINIFGKTNADKPCRIWRNILDRKDGTIIVRYKLYEPCSRIQINVEYNKKHIANSPYIAEETSYPDECDCRKDEMDHWLTSWECGEIPQQIQNDLSLHSQINWEETRGQIIERYNHPNSVSLCHYVIKNNEVYRKCYGKYVGFKMFMDAILLSLSRKMYLPDNEFFINLGDWPLVKDGTTIDNTNIDPIFSWCASTDSFDIVMPTYDITESTLENMGRVMLDMLSVQGNVEGPWNTRIPKVFWRGRDSNRERLDLILMARKHPDLFNASLTNFFFFRGEEHIYGPKVEHVSFFKFFDYKYQLNVDGTVAAYRFPYLLAGGSLVFKQDSKYYEHFYNEISRNVHYVPVKRDLSDLVEKVKWATENDGHAEKIARNGQKFAEQNLMPQNIFCYYAFLLNEFSKLIVNKIEVLEGMEKVEQPDKTATCKCVLESNRNTQTNTETKEETDQKRNEKEGAKETNTLEKINEEL